MLFILICFFGFAQSACPAGYYNQTALNLCLVCPDGCLACCD